MPYGEVPTDNLLPRGKTKVQFSFFLTPTGCSTKLNAQKRARFLLAFAPSLCYNKPLVHCILVSISGFQRTPTRETSLFSCKLVIYIMSQWYRILPSLGGHDLHENQVLRSTVRIAKITLTTIWIAITSNYLVILFQKYLGSSWISEFWFLTKF